MDAYGAVIERGIVMEAAEGGYKVKSLSRYGIVTPAIPAMYGGTIAEGEKVYFFLFDDGHGAILGKFE